MKNLLLDRYLRTAKNAGCPKDQIGFYVKSGIVLSPKQLLASAAARMCDFPGGPTGVGYGGARGGGKTHWLFSQLAEDCQRCAGLKCLLLRKIGKANRENVQDMRRSVMQGIPHDWKESQGIIVFPNGSIIVLGHYQNERDIDAYLGLSYDVIAVEEATTLTKSKNRLIRTCLRTSKTNWRPRYYATTNPGGVGHGWFKEQFITPYRKGTETTTRFIPATVDDNAFVNPEYKAELDALVGWEKRAYRYGDWDIAAGQFFSNFRESIDGKPWHVIKPFAIPKAWRKWCSLDYGFTHPTACHLFAQSGENDLFVVAEHGARKTLPDKHAEAITAMLDRVAMVDTVDPEVQVKITLDHLSRFVAGADVFAKKDGGPTIADDYKSYGIPLKAAIDDRINGAAEILRRLGDPEAREKPRVYIFETCTRLIEQLPLMVHDPHRPEDVLKVDCDEDGSGGDDYYDDFRYGVMEGKIRPKRRWEAT